MNGSPSVKVALFIRNGGSEFPCRWFYVTEIYKYMTLYEIIVKRSPKRKETVWDIISKKIPNICEYTREAVEKLYPEYLMIFDEMKSCTVHFNCNMFIGKKVIVDLYCEWLFKILEEVEKIYYEECGEVYKNREIGYLGEFLFRVWIEYNQVNYAIVNTINIENHIYALSEVKQIIRDVVKHNKKC